MLSVVVGGGIIAGCSSEPSVPVIVTALSEAGLPPSSLDHVPTDGAPARGPSRASVGVVAFVDPTDDGSGRLMRTLLSWVKEGDVRLAARLRPLPTQPASEQMALRWRSLSDDAFFDAWNQTELVAGAGISTAARLALARDSDEARRLRVTTVPTVFINGFRLTGVHPLDNYRAVADRFRSALAPLATTSTASFEARLQRHVRMAPPAPATPVVRRYRVRPEADSPHRGAEDPLVTIMFFSDFACEHSRQTWETLKDVLRDHPDVQVRFRHRPLASHPNSKNAARAAIAASLQGRFWPMVERLFREPDRHTEADLRRWARRVGLDVKKFDADRRSKPVYDKLDADRRVGDRLGFAGTPVLTVNGVRIVGHLPKVVIEDRIAVERAAAGRLLDAGVRRQELQAETVRRESERPVDPAPPRVRRRLIGSGTPPAVVAFLDASCPYSARVHRLLTELAREERFSLRWVHAPRDVPFARAAAERIAAVGLSEAAGQGGQWVVGLGFGRELDGRALRRIGPMPRSGARRAARRRVSSDLALAWASGVTDVPAVFVQGKFVHEPLDPDALRSAIRAARSNRPSRNETVKPRTLVPRPQRIP